MYLFLHSNRLLNPVYIQHRRYRGCNKDLIELSAGKSGKPCAAGSRHQKHADISAFHKAVIADCIDSRYHTQQNRNHCHDQINTEYCYADAFVRLLRQHHTEHRKPNRCDQCCGPDNYQCQTAYYKDKMLFQNICLLTCFSYLFYIISLSFLQRIVDAFYA